MPLSRRAFTASMLLAAATPLPAGASVSGAPRAAGAPVFSHGVASGDPLTDRVVLWTRVTPRALDTPVAVRYRIGTTADLAHPLYSGEVAALPQRDFTVKIDAVGLDPGRTYYYAFAADGESSPIGRTRTLPIGSVARVRLAVASCSNLPFGYFTVYGHIAARHDLDAVLHLGDYLYEYGPRDWGDGSDLGRAHEPAREIVTLADYRERHGQYKRDPDLQAAHRQHPWITVWDDHETANNSWFGGAQNHNPDKGEGDWLTRRAAGIRAYAEWMPIRELPDDDTGLRTFRSFAFGDLADLLMLDTRLHGRTEQAKRGDLATIADPTRTMLGLDQEAWLARQLRRSNSRGARFRLLGQQLLMGQLLDAARQPLNTDMWDGYAPARQRLFDQLAGENIRGVAVLTGDIHSAWGLDLTPAPFGGYDAGSGKGALAVEFVTPSVTSPPPFGNEAEARAREASVLGGLPHVKFVNFRERGYLLLDVDRDRTQGEWYFVDRIDSRHSTERLGGMYALDYGGQHLHPATTRSAAIAERPSVVDR